MKKYVSVFTMIARSTLYKNLTVMLLMAVSQIGLFLLGLQKYANLGKWTLTGTVKDSFMMVPFVIGLVVISVFLGETGCRRGSNQRYLFGRLQISERGIVSLQAIYNFITLIMLWAVEILVLIGVSFIYLQRTAEATGHTLVLAFYTNKWMHSVLPMKDAVGWALLCTLFVGLSLFLAVVSHTQRFGYSKALIGPAISLGLFAASFPRGMGSKRDAVTVCAAVVLYGFLVKAYVTIREKEGEEHEKAEN